MENRKWSANVDLPVTCISVACILVFVVFTVIYPDAMSQTVSRVFTVTTDALGPFLLWFYFIGLFVCLYLAFSRHGNIKLGDGDPQYSLFSYIAMMMCAALASASMYYSFVEWAYYYAEPTFRIEPRSVEAAEYAMAYSFFHWGFCGQVIFALTGVSMAYFVYVKKASNIKVSTVCGMIMGEKRYTGIIAKIIDIVCVFCTAGGLGITLGLGVPLISNGITRLTGIPGSSTMNVAIVLVMACVFSLSSYVGIERGMRRMSDYTIYLAIVFVGFILVVGPTKFIIRQFTNSIGVMLSNYVRMSLWTDPIESNGFPEAWTMYLFAFVLNYSSLMGVFLTKISKGRTVRELILSCVIGISVGTWIIFGANGGFALDCQLTGQFDVANMVQNSEGQKAIYSLLDLLPGGGLVCLVFLAMVIGFLSTSLDSAAFSLSATASKTVGSAQNTSPLFRLFWCVVLAAIPLSIMFVGAPFSALKTIAIVVSLPFTIAIAYMVYGLFKALRS